MSVASEITRIQGAKADLKTAINAKTDAQHQITTETIDDYADFVDSISTGSGKPEQSKTTNPSTSQVVVTPDTGYTLSSVTVNGVTSSIDSNIQAGNIKKNVNILGVTGTYEGGTTPTGTISITTNGTYDVTSYASANVNTPTYIIVSSVDNLPATSTEGTIAVIGE